MCHFGLTRFAKIHFYHCNTKSKNEVSVFMVFYKSSYPELIPPPFFFFSFFKGRRQLRKMLFFSQFYICCRCSLLAFFFALFLKKYILSALYFFALFYISRMTYGFYSKLLDGRQIVLFLNYELLATVINLSLMYLFSLFFSRSCNSI